MSITIEYRNALGQAVPPNPGPITFIQWTSSTSIYTTTDTTVSVTWGNDTSATIYFPADTLHGGPPYVHYTTGFRIDVSSLGTPDPTNIICHTATGDIYVDPNDSGVGIFVSIPSDFSATASLALVSGPALPGELELTAEASAEMAAGRGLPITLSSTAWALNRLDVKIRPEERG